MAISITPLKDLLCIFQAVEKPFLDTPTLVLSGDQYAIPDNNWRSFSFLVKTGAVRVSDDGGTVFKATQDPTDAPALLGQGNLSRFDASLLVIEATVDGTTLQIVADYI